MRFAFETHVLRLLNTPGHVGKGVGKEVVVAWLGSTRRGSVTHHMRHQELHHMAHSSGECVPEGIEGVGKNGVGGRQRARRRAHGNLAVPAPHKRMHECFQTGAPWRMKDCIHVTSTRSALSKHNHWQGAYYSKENGTSYQALPPSSFRDSSAVSCPRSIPRSS